MNLKAEISRQLDMYASSDFKLQPPFFIFVSPKNYYLYFKIYKM